MENILNLTKKLNVIYAEDDQTVAFVTKRFLGRIFNNVHHFENGALALNFFTENSNTDLIITDITMPEMNGIDLILNIRKTNKSVPIIAVSAHQSEYNTQLSELDIPLLVKPLNIDELYMVVKEQYPE